MTLDQMKDAVILELVDLVHKAYIEGYCHAAIEYKRPNLPNLDKMTAKAERDWNTFSMSKEYLDFISK